MTNTYNIKNINKFMLDFLEKSKGSTNPCDEWTSGDNQKKLISVLRAQKKKNKVKKDPSSPKRGRSAYILYCSEQRPIVKLDMPDAKPTDITRELGARWRKIRDSKSKDDVDSKKNYEKMAAEDKLRYTEEIKNYEPPEGTESSSDEKKKNPDSPKRPATAYLLFCKEERFAIKKETPDLGAKDVMKEIGSRWGTLKAYKKTEDVTRLSSLLEMASEGKKRYDEAIESQIPSNTGKVEVEVEEEVEEEEEEVQMEEEQER